MVCVLGAGGGSIRNEKKKMGQDHVQEVVYH